MSKRQVRWAEVKRSLEALGFTVGTHGGDKVIKPPKGWPHRSGPITHRVGHKFSQRSTSELPPAHIKALMRKFGLTIEQLTGQKPRPKKPHKK